MNQGITVTLSSDAIRKLMDDGHEDVIVELQKHAVQAVVNRYKKQIGDNLDEAFKSILSNRYGMKDIARKILESSEAKTAVDIMLADLVDEKSNKLKRELLEAVETQKTILDKYARDVEAWTKKLTKKSEIVHEEVIRRIVKEELQAMFAKVGAK
jgi:Arc/MetJ family transcription regulator